MCHRDLAGGSTCHYVSRLIGQCSQNRGANRILHCLQIVAGLLIQIFFANESIDFGYVYLNAHTTDSSTATLAVTAHALGGRGGRESDIGKSSGNVAVPLAARARDGKLTCRDRRWRPGDFRRPVSPARAA